MKKYCSKKCQIRKAQITLENSGLERDQGTSWWRRMLGKFIRMLPSKNVTGREIPCEKDALIRELLDTPEETMEKRKEGVSAPNEYLVEYLVDSLNVRIRSARAVKDWGEVNRLSKLRGDLVKKYDVAIPLT